eukprot:7444883-Pyramimonas_sp.AAC.1
MQAKVEDPEAREATLGELQQLRDLCSGSGSSAVFSMSLLLRARAKLSAVKGPWPRQHCSHDAETALVVVPPTGSSELR